jgi:hypothetical protein
MRMSFKPQQNQDFLALQDIVRQQDSDRYAISLFCPRAARPVIWTLLAFNYEIARTREVVSEKMLGHIRLQWWREALEEIYVGLMPRRHEVVEPLAKIIQQYDLPQEPFENLIQAREKQLEEDNIFDPAEQARATNAPLNFLIGQLFQSRKLVDINIALRHGLIGQARLAVYQKNTTPEHIRSFLSLLPKVENLRTLNQFDRAQEALNRLYLSIFEEAKNHPTPEMLEIELPVKIFRIWKQQWKMKLGFWS